MREMRSSFVKGGRCRRGRSHRVRRSWCRSWLRMPATRPRAATPISLARSRTTTPAPRTGARARSFFAWCDTKGIADLVEVEPFHVGAYLKAIGATHEKPTVKQHLAAIRMLFDWLVVGQVIAINPAHSVRGPKHVIKRGKTPVLTPAEARKLLDAIDVSTRRRPARSGSHRPHGLFIRARQRRDRHAGRGLLRPGQALVGAPQRKRRQAPRNALPSQSRSLSRRLSRRGPDRRGEEELPSSAQRAAVPDS